MEFPKGCVHVVLGDEIIGQIEMRLRDDSLGYINLFYLIPKCRKAGLGNQLHRYSEALMREIEVSKMQLSVSPTNSQATTFYEKNGWRNLGLKQPDNLVYLMELQL